MTHNLREIYANRDSLSAIKVMDNGRHHGHNYNECIKILQGIANREGWEFDPAEWDSILYDGDNA
jgi:hypothetical protein